MSETSSSFLCAHRTNSPRRNNRSSRFQQTFTMRTDSCLILNSSCLNKSLIPAGSTVEVLPNTNGQRSQFHRRIRWNKTAWIHYHRRICAHDECLLKSTKMYVSKKIQFKSVYWGIITGLEITGGPKFQTGLTWSGFVVRILVRISNRAKRLIVIINDSLER